MITRWLRRLFGSDSDPGGPPLSLGEGPLWEVSGEPTLPSFLKATPELVGQDATLYIEGRPPRDVAEYLAARSVDSPAHIAKGTIIPWPRCFHMPVTVEGLAGLASLVDKYIIAEVLDHLHVYDSDGLLLEWYDACCLDSFYASMRIPEVRLEEFCRRTGMTYGIYTPDAGRST
jgi:hypothetical protein